MAERAVRSTGNLGGRVPGSGVRLLWAVAAALAAMLPGALAAQEGSPAGVRASLSADRDALTVGDLVTMTLQVTHPAGHVVVVPRLGPEWGPFEIASQTTARAASNGDGTETTSQQLTATIFEPGAFETPDLSIAVRGPDGRVEQVSPRPLRMTVHSVLSEADEELKDIRPPADLASPAWRRSAAFALTGAAVLATAAVSAYVARRRLEGRETRPTPAVDARTPWEIAVQEIDRVERLDLPGAGRFKEHYARVAGAMQRYVRAMYLEDSVHRYATEMTTDEIGAAISQSSLDRDNARLVVDLLVEADLCRFSAYTPPETQAYDALRRARGFLEGTRPRAGEAARPEAKT